MSFTTVRTPQSATATGATASVPVPPGTVAGDVCDVWILLRDAASNATVTAPTGAGTWTQRLNSAEAGFGSRFVLFTKVSTGSEPATWDFTLDSSRDYTMIANAAPGGDGTLTGTPVVQQRAMGVTGYTSPSITPTVDGALVRAGFFVDENGDRTPITADTSPAATSDKTVTNSGDWQTGYTERYVQPTAAAVALDMTFATATVDSGQKVFAAILAWAPSAAVSPPSNTVAPSISGTAQVGDTLTGSDGTWTGSPTSFTRQWYRDNSGGGVYSAIAGATGTTYTLVDADDACNIKFGVIATNAGGSSAEVRSAAVGPIIEQLPVNTVAPSISGTAQVGDTLTGSDGTWTHVPTSYTRQWYRDNQGGGIFSAIAGATGTTYVLVDADDECQIEFGVAATNDDGTAAEVRSAATGAVVEPAPVNTVAPAITGTAKVGNTLSCDNGTWDHMAGSSASFTYQWRSSSDGGTTWTDITGATASTYTPVEADVGDDLDCVVAAHNSGSP